MKIKLKKMNIIRRNRIKMYLRATADELNELADEEIFNAVLIRMNNKVNGYKKFNDGINSLSLSQRIVYCLNYYEMEVNNGGLCQFFTNTRSFLAPYVSEYLKNIKAKEHKKLFDNFIKVNKIDLNDLSSFAIKDSDNYMIEYNERKNRYPFDDFDEEFYKLESLEKYLVEYIRKNINEF